MLLTIKYSKKLYPKSIWFCIDGFNISYRENKDKTITKDGKKDSLGQAKSQNNQSSSGIFGSISNKIFGAKQKSQPISSIINYKRYKDPSEFSITFQKVDKKDEIKEVRYRSLYADDASQIIAKIKFLKTAQGSKSMFNNSNHMANSVPLASNFH